MIIHFSMQFSAVLDIFIVKTYLNSIFTNDFKRKEKLFRKMLIVTDLVSLNFNAVNHCVTLLFYISQWARLHFSCHHETEANFSFYHFI